MEKTTESIISVLSEATHKEDLQNIDLDQNLKDQGIDSLDIMSFFFSLEKQFEVKISSEDQSKLHNINDILNFLKQGEVSC
jgi:acyl carrier protein